MFVCVSINNVNKERMDKMNIIGVDVYTNKAMPVDLVVVKGDVGWTSLIFADNITGFGMV